ncbi:MAG: hypothetical protein ACK55Z_21010, partial [bacterium]
HNNVQLMMRALVQVFHQDGFILMMALMEVLWIQILIKLELIVTQKIQVIHAIKAMVMIATIRMDKTASTNQFQLV